MSLLLALLLTTPKQPDPRPSDHEIQEMLAEEYWGRFSSTGIRLRDVVIRNSACAEVPMSDAEKQLKSPVIFHSEPPEMAVECRYDMVLVASTSQKSDIKNRMFRNLHKQRKLSRQEEQEIETSPVGWQPQTRRFLYYSSNSCQYMGRVPRGPQDCQVDSGWHVIDNWQGESAKRSSPDGGAQAK
jgi:hypothetical protein